jgi:hypothetical protein
MVLVNFTLAADACLISPAPVAPVTDNPSKGPPKNDEVERNLHEALCDFAAP